MRKIINSVAVLGLLFGTFSVVGWTNNPSNYNVQISDISYEEIVAGMSEYEDYYQHMMIINIEFNNHSNAKKLCNLLFWEPIPSYRGCVSYPFSTSQELIDNIILWGDVDTLIVHENFDNIDTHTFFEPEYN